MSEPLTPEALVEMKERCARATPGPWTKLTTVNLVGVGFCACPGESFKPSEGLANGEFVLAARTDLPAALAMIADLLDVIAHAKRYMDHSPECPTRTHDRPCRCGFEVAEEGMMLHMSPAWRSVATVLKREGT